MAICAGDDGELAAAAKMRGSAKLFARAADVTDPAAVTSFVEAAALVMCGLDVLVNNAGRAHPGNFAKLSDEDWQADLDVKLMSQVRCVRAALPHLRQSAAALVININPSTPSSPTQASSRHP